MITSFIQKYFVAFFAAGMLLGFFFPVTFLPISEWTLLILGAVITLTFITLDFKAAATNFKNLHHLGAVILISKAVLPFILYQAAKPLGPEISIAVLLLSLTPFAGISPTLTSIIGGDTEFILLEQVIQTLIAPFYMPALMFIFAGANIETDVMSMMKTLLFLIIIPFLLSIAFRFFFRRTIEKTKKYYSSINILLITLLLSGLLASAAEPVRANPLKALPMAGWTFLLAIVLALTGWFCFFFLDRKKRIGLAIGNMYMNIGLSAVLAASYFGPEVTMFVLLYELPANLIPSLIRKIINMQT